jgi:hypothetical protein
MKKIKCACNDCSINITIEKIDQDIVFTLCKGRSIIRSTTLTENIATSLAINIMSTFSKTTNYKDKNCRSTLIFTEEGILFIGDTSFVTNKESRIGIVDAILEEIKKEN